MDEHMESCKYFVESYLAALLGLCYRTPEVVVLVPAREAYTLAEQRAVMGWCEAVHFAP